MLCGAASLAMVFGILTDVILHTRLRDLYSRGCSKMKGHIVVAGLGHIGFRVARALVQQGNSVVGIERDAQQFNVDAARTFMPVVLGDAGVEETLVNAGVAGASAVMALYSVVMPGMLSLAA